MNEVRYDVSLLQDVWNVVLVVKDMTVYLWCLDKMNV